MRACVCGGLKPGCPRCGGTGFTTEKSSTIAPNISRSVGKRFGSRLTSTQGKKSSLGNTKKVSVTSNISQERQTSETSAVPEIDRPTVNCPQCGVEVRESRLQKHIRKAHKPATNAASRSLPAGKFAPTAKKTVATKNTPLQRSRDSTEGFKSEYEPSFGGKNLGYLARENGKFGSLPLYDDYSDESDAN